MAPGGMGGGDKAERGGRLRRGGEGRIVRKTVFEEKSDIRRLAAQKSRGARPYNLRPLWLLRSRGRPSRSAAERPRSAAGKQAWGSAPEPSALRRRNYL